MTTAISQIGTVNLLTGKNATFDLVWNCWREGCGTNMLVRFGDKLKVIHTSGEDRDADGDVAEYCNDQSGRSIGHGTKIASRPHTQQGLRELAEIAGKKTLVMATIK